MTRLDQIEWIVGLLLGGGAAGAGGLWAWLSSRTKGRADIEAARIQAEGPAAIVEAAAVLQQALTAEAQRLVEAQNERIDRLEVELRESRAAEARCTEQMADLRSRFDLLRAGVCPPPYDIGKGGPTP